MTYCLVPADLTILPLPRTTFPCPICQAALLAELDAWTLEEDGSGWAVAEGGLHLECTTEPDLDSDDWDPWFRGHQAMPYVDWLPLYAPVLAWINGRYRWQREGATL